MEVYAVDGTSLLPIAVFDNFASLVWTERYSAAGDVVFEVLDSAQNRVTLTEGNFLSIPTSTELMMIESRESENGILKVVGTSLFGFLKNRILRRSWDNKYGFCLFTGVPGSIPGQIMKNFVIAGYNGIMEQNAVVPNGSAEMMNNISVGYEDLTTYTASVSIPVKHGNVYDAIKAVCDSYSFGFKLYITRYSGSYTIYYTTYSGTDRTSRQSVNPLVRFTTAIDALQNSKELISIAGYKNVAYAFAPNVQTTASYLGTAYANTAAQTASNFKRRSLLVEADDIQAADVDLTTTNGQQAFRDLLTQRAKDALANNNYVRMVDGEIVPQSAYTYQKDYFLGDVIELGSTEGFVSYARVTEYITTQDNAGQKAYPTLSVL